MLPAKMLDELKINFTLIKTKDGMYYELPPEVLKQCIKIAVLKLKDQSLDPGFYPPEYWDDVLKLNDQK